MFTEPLAAKILEGEKTATRRVMNDNPRSPWFRGRCGYRVSQVFTVNPGRGVGRVAECEVTAVFAQAPSAVSKRQAKTEGFKSGREFLDGFRQINRGVDLSEKVWVVEFTLDGPYCRGCDGCGWCEGSPAWTCTDCGGTGRERNAAARELLRRVHA